MEPYTYLIDTIVSPSIKSVLLLLKYLLYYYTQSVYQFTHKQIVSLKFLSILKYFMIEKVLKNWYCIFQQFKYLLSRVHYIHIHIITYSFHDASRARFIYIGIILSLSIFYTVFDFLILFLFQSKFLSQW